MKQGQYAEIMTEYAEHIYQKHVNKTERNYRFIAAEGTSREVDVCTILTTGEMIAFEVRDRHSTQGIEWIDQIIGKYYGSPFMQVWLCTFDGCTLSSNAIKKLNHHKIGWRDFELVRHSPINSTIPTLMIEGILPIKNEIEILVNGIKYNDLHIETVNCNGNDEDISFKDEKVKQFQGIAAANYLAFADINFFKISDDIDVNNIKNNFNASCLSIETTIPLQHKVFMDYFDENYIVKNNHEKTFMVATKEKSVFLTDSQLVINLSFFGNMKKDGVVFNSFFKLNISSIPETYRKQISTWKLIDVNGTGKGMAITKIFGVW
ncbi:MAG: hypothetical protein WDA65_05875 [Christensenellales bacterium]